MSTPPPEQPEQPTQPLVPATEAATPARPGLHGVGLVAAIVGLILLGAVPTYALTKAHNDPDSTDASGHHHGDGPHRSQHDDQGYAPQGPGQPAPGQGYGRQGPAQGGPGLGRMGMGMRGFQPSEACLKALQGLRTDLQGQLQEGTAPSPVPGRPFLSDDQRQQLREACAPGTSAQPVPTPQASPKAGASPQPAPSTAG